MLAAVYDRACWHTGQRGWAHSVESYSEDQVRCLSFSAGAIWPNTAIRGTQATLHILTEFAPGTQRIQTYTITSLPTITVAGTRTIYLETASSLAEARHSWARFHREWSATC